MEIGLELNTVILVASAGILSVFSWIFVFVYVYVYIWEKIRFILSFICSYKNNQLKTKFNADEQDKKAQSALTSAVSK